jgi:Pyruvate/2-oxoacid:ferredoxin oxidoreductase gamma subunit
MEIAIIGKGGQGIQTLGKTLGKILEDKGYYIAMTYEYDSFIRNAKSNVYLKFSTTKLKNPLVQNPKIYSIKTNNIDLLKEILTDLKIKTNINRYLPKKIHETSNSSKTRS